MTVASQALSLSPGLGDAQRSLLKTMGRSAVRMQRLIDQLLVYTQSLTGVLALAKETVDLVDLARTVIDDLSGPSPCEIVLECADEEPIEADRERIEQVLDNLIANACRHGTGTVTVRIARAGGQVMISVHNAGAPITREQLASLFDPFTGGARRRGSYGLGLYIADRIARAHRGSIEVSSTERDGTTFVVTLPVA
jgi:signal transduction histidine kinase